MQLEVDTDTPLHGSLFLWALVAIWYRAFCWLLYSDQIWISVFCHGYSSLLFLSQVMGTLPTKTERLGSHNMKNINRITTAPSFKRTRCFLHRKKKDRFLFLFLFEYFKLILKNLKIRHRHLLTYYHHMQRFHEHSGSWDCSWWQSPLWHCVA